MVERYTGAKVADGIENDDYDHFQEQQQMRELRKPCRQSDIEITDCNATSAETDSIARAVFILIKSGQAQS